MLLSLLAVVSLVLSSNMIDGVEDVPKSAELPSAARCAAIFAMTFEELSGKSGDPAMTRGFGEDAAALRAIVVAQSGGELAADAVIAAERRLLSAARAPRGAGEEEAAIDLGPCYRVKALGPRGE